MKKISVTKAYKSKSQCETCRIGFFTEGYQLSKLKSKTSPQPQSSSPQD